MGTKKRNSFFLSPFFLAIVCALLAASPASHAGPREVDLLCEIAVESLNPSGPHTATELKNRFLNVENVQDVSIEEFLRVIRTAPEHPRLVVHFENAVLKELKDEAFQDGELAVTVTNLYKQILFDLLMSDKELANRAIGMYGDYKSARVVLNADRPDLKERLQDVFEATNRVFANVIRLHPELKAQYEQRHGIAVSPLHWHQAGFGEGPLVEADEAATAARAARDFHDEKVTPRIHDFHAPEVQHYLHGRFERTELARRRVVDLLDALDGKQDVLTTVTAEGNRVLSRRFLRIVMSARSLKPHEFVPYVRRRLRLETGIDLPSELLAPVTNKSDLTVLDYVQAMDAFSPSPYQKSEIVDMGLRHQAEEFVIIDGVGQSAENTYELATRLAAIAKSTKRLAEVDLAKVARITRQGQDIASGIFEKRGEIVDSILSSPELRVHPGFSKDKKPVHSGDDTVLGLADRSSDGEKLRVIDHFRTQLRANGNRIAFMSARYYNPKTKEASRAVPVELRGHYEDAALYFEKDLRLELLEVRREYNLSVEDLEATVLGIHLIPYEGQDAGIRVFASGPRTDNLTRALEEASARVIVRDRHNVQLMQVIVPPKPAARRGLNQLPEISIRHASAASF